MNDTKRSGGTALIASVVAFLVACPGKAGVPEPDYVLHGNVTLNGLPVDASRTVRIEGRVGGTSVGFYDMGESEQAGDEYVLRILIETAVPGSPADANAAQVGDIVEIYAIDDEDRICETGANPGTPCTDGSECLGGGICVPRETLLAQLRIVETGVVKRLDLGSCSQAVLSSRLYVNPAAGGSGDGTSWADAADSLDVALASRACVGEFVSEIWVAAGTYLPTTEAVPGEQRSATFSLPDGLMIYGGFAGVESGIDERVPLANPSILSGDVGLTGVKSDNAYHVVTSVGSGAGTLLDGFTITGGQADGTVSDGRGGGLRLIDSRASIVGCTVLENSARTAGGGAYIAGGGPTFTGCRFEGNEVTQGDGGAIHNLAPATTIASCTFFANAASGTGDRRGGAIFNSAAGGPVCTGGSADGTACTDDAACPGGECGGVNITRGSFTGNSANSGGAVFNLGSSPLVSECGFFGNLADRGGAIHNEASSHALVVNSVFVGNRGLSGGGAIYNRTDSTPAFTNCTLVGNVSPSGAGGGIGSQGNAGNAVTVANSILWGNTAAGGSNDEDRQLESAGVSVNISYSCVQGWTGNLGGAGNFGDNPMFEREPHDGGDGWGVGGNDDFGDLRLTFQSTCCDAGSNDADTDPVFNPAVQALPGNLLSLAAPGLPEGLRFHDNICVTDSGAGAAPIVDVGAFEYRTPTPESYMFVDSAAVGAESGDAWADALTNLDLALCVASNSGGAVQELWVAGGAGRVYTPTVLVDSGDPRSAAFRLRSGVVIRGGLAGDEDPQSFDLADRDFESNETVLSGDLAGDDDSGGSRAENAYHVVIVSAADATALLDGVTVSDGYANASSGSNTIGGGILISTGNPSLRNCLIRDNVAVRGGGLYVSDSAAPELTHCTVTSNHATTDGGGMFNRFLGNPALINCSILANTTAGVAGGMGNQDGSSPTLVNCLVAQNQASGIWSINGSNPTITNCTVVDNAAWGVQTGSGAAGIVNSVVWGNIAGQVSGGATVNYSCVQNGWGGTGGNNISADPLFVGSQMGNYRLDAGSPCGDAGDNGSVPINVMTDLDGNPRIVNSTVDIGAYELQGGALTDIGSFVNCMAGPGLPPAPAPPLATQDCLDAFDFDMDGDVDLEDFAAATFFTQP